jgi:hypothetical protein
MNQPLITKAEYDTLSPRTQGFIQYWQGGRPGSELKGLTNPYAAISKEHKDWDAGQANAVQEAQDSEE